MKRAVLEKSNRSLLLKSRRAVKKHKAAVRMMMKKSRLLLRNNHRCLYNQMMTRILTMRSLRNYMGLERITRLQSLRLKVIPKTPKKNQLRKREASPARKEDHRLQRKRNRNRPKVKGSKKSKNLLLPLRNQ
jgi:hypothetical protein